MRARIESDFARDAFKVWLAQPHGMHGDMTVLGFDADGYSTFTVLKPGATPDRPTMVLPRVALEALVREASNVLPPSDATVDALRDTRVIRDRLLTLVERSMGGAV